MFSARPWLNLLIKGGCCCTVEPKKTNEKWKCHKVKEAGNRQIKVLWQITTRVGNKAVQAFMDFMYYLMAVCVHHHLQGHAGQMADFDDGVFDVHVLATAQHPPPPRSWQPSAITDLKGEWKGRGEKGALQEIDVVFDGSRLRWDSFSDGERKLCDHFRAAVSDYSSKGIFHKPERFGSQGIAFPPSVPEVLLDVVKSVI